MTDEPRPSSPALGIQMGAQGADAGPVSDRRRLVKTDALRRHAGIYSRQDGDGRHIAYVAEVRDRTGRKRRRSAATIAEAKRLRAEMLSEVSAGRTGQEGRVPFDAYARRWVETYAGRTSTGLREVTRNEYRGLLDRFAIKFFRATPLRDITRDDLRRFAVWVAEKRDLPPSKRQGRRAKDTVRLAVAPVRLLLATAHDDGIIGSNPAQGLRLAVPARQPAVAPDEDLDEGRAKALSADEFAALLTSTPEAHRPFIAFLEETGLRISEARALTWADLDLDERYLTVRRRYRLGTVDVPKSREGRRTIRLRRATADALRERRAASVHQLVWPGPDGGYLDIDSFRRTVLRRAGRAAGVPWVGYHSLRHTCASRMIRNGASPRQVQAWLGHADPAFTLRTYVHLFPSDLPDPDELGD